MWIDGDHSYKGSKQDFESYSELVDDNGLIFMHDTAPNGINNQQPEWCGVWCECTVALLTSSGREHEEADECAAVRDERDPDEISIQLNHGRILARSWV